MKLETAPYSHYCLNPDIKEKHPIFDLITIAAGNDWHHQADDNYILFVRKGFFEFSLGHFYGQEIGEGKMLMVPIGYNISIKAKAVCSIMLMKIPLGQDLCDCFATQSLINEQGSNENQNLFFLEENYAVSYFLKGIEMYDKAGVNCKCLNEIKIKELFIILRMYYPRKDLWRFFYYHLNNDIQFSAIVIKNRNSVKNLEELAQLTNYSLSGFRKHFKRVFGESPYKWLTQQRAENIFHDIKQNRKSLKEIADEYNFSSMSHFHAFCKKEFGKTPKTIQSEKPFFGE